MRRLRRSLFAAALLAMACVWSTPEMVGASSATSQFVPVTPCRLLDTRITNQPFARGETRLLQVSNACGVPTGAIAAALTVTVDRAAADGWVSVAPAGAPIGGTSNLNVGRGQTRANGVVVGLSATGAIAIHSDAGGDLIVDVTGAFVPASSASSGRFVPVALRRIVDTRASGRPAPGAEVIVSLPAEVPADAVALAVNVTTAGSSPRAGYFTVYPAGTARPEVSNLNTDGPGQDRAAFAIVPVSPAGFTVYTSNGDHVIVDLVGYFTGPSAQASSSGLFTPVTPVRIADTRADGPEVFRNGTREWAITPWLGSNVGAILVNVTMVGPWSDGWIAAHPSRTPLPEVSSVNARAGQTVANLAVVPLSTQGLAVYSAARTHVVIDLYGWFVNVTPIPATLGPPLNLPPGPGRTLFVTDSSGAAIRWSGQVHLLPNFPSVFDGESCRRTAVQSCRGREGYPPPNAVQAIRSAPGHFDTVVLMVGYNDSHVGFGWAIDQVMNAARSRGVRQVVWMTLRTQHRYSMPGDRGNSGHHHALINRHLYAALGRHPDLKLLDWNSYSAGKHEWFTRDGVHVSAGGVPALIHYWAYMLPRIS